MWMWRGGIMQDAARDIAANGTLPEEMARGQRALFYHVFSVVPLVLMAEMATKRGEDWYALGNGAVHRLVQLSASGLANPETFDRLASVPQERPINTRAGWLQVYQRRFPGRLTQSLPEVAEGHRWLGGSVTVLLAALAR